MTEPVPSVNETQSWNEIQFLSWKEFRQMGPSILQLEITRLGKALRSLEGRTESYNHLVRARFELTRFVACLQASEQDALARGCAAHLQAAIMTLSLRPEDPDPATRDACRYVLDRLTAVHHRLDLIY